MKSIHAVAGILWRGNRFLAVQRPSGKIMAGYWEFPGGKIEPGETPDNALQRELGEELGVTDIRASFWRTERHAYDHGRITLEIYHVRGFSGEPSALEGQGLRWVTSGEALGLDFLPADLPVVRDLAALPASSRGGT